MTTEKKLERLKSEGWDISFNDEYIAKRGFVVYKSPNVTSLYKSIKQ